MTHLLAYLVLSRTLYYPVDLDYSCCNSNEASSDMWHVVKKHLHRMRSISWDADCPDISLLIHPAPLLETLSGSLMLDVPSNFLGGVPGNLRRLHVGTLRLPETCPALSTVTDLKFATGSHSEDSAFLTRLFVLFPRLESLDLDLHVRDASLLPSEPAPSSLTSLRLNTIDKQYDFTENFNRLDLIGLCKSWKIFPRIKSLRLCSLILDEMDFASILNGAIRLSISRDEYWGQHSLIVAHHSGERAYALDLGHRKEGEQEKLVQLMLADQQCLSRLQSLRMTSNKFAFFAPDVEPLPLLTELSIIVSPEMDPSVRVVAGQVELDFLYSLSWSYLNRLPVLPQLETMEVSVRTERYAPNAADAQALAATLTACLAVFEGPQNVLVKISGFLAEATTGVEVPSGSGFSILFE